MICCGWLALVVFDCAWMWCAVLRCVVLCWVGLCLCLCVSVVVVVCVWLNVALCLSCGFGVGFAFVRCKCVWGECGVLFSVCLGFKVCLRVFWFEC